MKKLNLLTVFCLAVFMQSLQAQFPVDGPYQSIPVPANVNLPNYLETVIDNSVPSPIAITRITDYCAACDWYPTYSYSKIQVWNADQTKFKIRAWKVYDATTYQEVQSLSGMYPAYWSNTDSDILWSFQDNGKIKKHSVSNNNTQVLATITKSDGTAYDYLKLGPWEANMDKNDKYVALVGKSGGDLDVIIYDLQTNTKLHTETFQDAWTVAGSNLGPFDPKYIDWVSVSQSGDYVAIMWDNGLVSPTNPHNGHYGVELYNTTDMKYLRRLADFGNHGDLGYAADGREVFVQFWGPDVNETINMYYLDGSGRVAVSSNHDFYNAGHISCRNINRPGWAYISIDDPNQSGQIVALKMEQNGEAEHFGHHFSSVKSYDQSPMPIPSPDGTKLMFKSDFGTDPTGDAAYCFEAKLATGVDVDALTAQEVTVYPNPSNGYLSIKSVIENLNVNRIEIYNETGALVLKKDIILNTLKLNLPNGMYFIKLIGKNKSYVKKLMMSK